MVCRQGMCHIPRCLTCTLHMLTVLCLVSTTRGLHMAEAQGTVEIYPIEPTVQSGQSINLTCEVAHSNVLTADEITWSRDGMALSSDLYSALNSKRSRLLIQGARFQDSGLYACDVGKSSQQGGNSTQVNVGVPPSKAKDLTCFSRNDFDVTCKWTPGKDTNIATTYTLLFLKDGNREKVHDEWPECTNVLPGNKSCMVERVHEIYYFKVVSQNRLGNASTDIILFNHETETVPNPPRDLRIQATTPHSRLNVTWNFPEEWHEGNYLQYKIEYYKDRLPTVSMEYLGPTDKTITNHQVEMPFPQLLDAYTMYCAKVAARKDLCEVCLWSDWTETVCERTLEQKPDAQLNANISWTNSETNQSRRHILLEWEPLSEASSRGVILGYRVMNVTVVKKDVITSVTLDASQTSVEIKDLERLQKYTFAIEAFNDAGASPTKYLVIPEDHPQYISSAVVIVIALSVTLLIPAILGLIWYGVKRLRLLEPLPSIYFIAPEQFERILERPSRRVAEKEVFDLPLNHRAPNGVIPNGIIGNSHSSQGACAADDDYAGYVVLREEAGKESDPLLFEQDSCRKLSQISTDSANSSDRDLYSPSSTMDGSGKLLFVHIPPESPSLERLRTGFSRSVLESTDSGYGDNSAENRVPSYMKLSSIPSDPETVEAPTSGEFDTGSDDSRGDVYHQLGRGEVVTSDLDLTSDQSQILDCIYGEQTMPSYTRISAIPGPLSNGIPPSVDIQEHLSCPNGHVLNGTLPSIDAYEPGSA